MKIIIARYRENIDWVNSLRDADVLIYNKFFQTCDHPSIVLPNIGRESHTYLYHIVTNYNNLADHTCFLQGDPAPHCPDIVNAIKTHDASQDVIHLGNIADTQIDGRPHHPGLDIAQFRKFVDIPDAWEFNVGAQFILSRKCITKHSLEFYQQLLDMHHTYANTPWCLERIWKFIFA